MRFLEYEMHNSNECKRNFVAIYDGSSSVEHLKNKFCSTVANDVMLVSSVGVVRLWADEGSRKSKFKILFTTFHEREWHPGISSFLALTLHIIHKIFHVWIRLKPVDFIFLVNTGNHAAKYISRNYIMFLFLDEFVK